VDPGERREGEFRKRVFPRAAGRGTEWTGVAPVACRARFSAVLTSAVLGAKSEHISPVKVPMVRRETRSCSEPRPVSGFLWTQGGRGPRSSAVPARVLGPSDSASPRLGGDGEAAIQG